VTPSFTDGAASAPFSVVGRKPVARFAPSPTGPLHAGSLLAAMGSYLDARAHGARWLVRIEDLDTPRVIPGCAAAQLRTLEAFGFEWDGEVLYQSTRREAYREAMAALGAAGRTFRCSCSRKDLAGDNGEEPRGYAGTCRDGPARSGPTSLRLRIGDAPVQFDDLYLGPQSVSAAASGDVVIERRDGIATYQLAVVVDDAHQQVTRVVRGADLLASTAWQIELQRALRVPTPIYGHLPLLLEPDGRKLSKSAHALPVIAASERGEPTDPAEISRILTSTLTLLSQAPPVELANSPIQDVWKWAVMNWQPQALAGALERRLSAPSDR
jgi:glutamyl-Q tRNA(Asp) synthetase